MPDTLSGPSQPLDDLDQAFHDATFIYPLFNDELAPGAELSTHEGRREADIDEWKLLTGSAQRESFDLAHPSLGGDLVWSSVPPHLVDEVLLTDGASDTLNDRRPNDLVFVLGFHHGRAAQVSQLDVTQSPQQGNYRDEVVVEALVTSPVGPYEPVGTWRLGDGAWELDGAVWARYLRFTVPGPEEGVRKRSSCRARSTSSSGPPTTTIRASSASGAASVARPSPSS